MVSESICSTPTVSNKSEYIRDEYRFCITDAMHLITALGHVCWCALSQYLFLHGGSPTAAQTQAVAISSARCRSPLNPLGQAGTHAQWIYTYMTYMVVRRLTSPWVPLVLLKKKNRVETRELILFLWPGAILLDTPFETLGHDLSLSQVSCPRNKSPFTKRKKEVTSGQTRFRQNTHSC